MSTYMPGDYVKVEFADESSDEKEWMWVCLESSNHRARLVFGRLDSQPVVSAKLELGQQLAVSYDKIRDHQRFPKA